MSGAHTPWFDELTTLIDLTKKGEDYLALNELAGLVIAVLFGSFVARASFNF